VVSATAAATTATVVAARTRPLTAGSHTLTATAYDRAGQSTTDTRFVTIADLAAPTVAITAPAASSTVGGAVTVAATAADDRAVARVEFSVDGKLTATDSTAPYAFTWNADAVILGAHTLSARAVDTAGRATVAKVTVTVADLTAPTVALTAPAAGATVVVGSKVTVSANAADNRRIARVEFWIDGVLKLKDTSAPFAYVWTVPTPRGARHTLLVRAVDPAGLIANASVVVTAG